MFQEYYKSKAKYYSDEIQRFNEKNLGKLNDFNDAVKKYKKLKAIYDKASYYINKLPYGRISSIESLYSQIESNLDGLFNKVVIEALKSETESECLKKLQSLEDDLNSSYGFGFDNYISKYNESLQGIIKKNNIIQKNYKMNLKENSTRNIDYSKDPMYKEIIEFVCQTGKASASLIQRRFKLGYNRAAHLIDMLEEDEIIGPNLGSVPRNVLVSDKTDFIPKRKIDFVSIYGTDYEAIEKSKIEKEKKEKEEYNQFIDSYVDNAQSYFDEKGLKIKFNKTKRIDKSKLNNLLLTNTSGEDVEKLVNYILSMSVPNEIKLLLIDYSQINLFEYNGLSNLYAPIISDYKKANISLDLIKKEMNRRYDLFLEKKVKNVDSYNDTIDIENKLPYILIVINELFEMLKFENTKDIVSELLLNCKRAGIIIIGFSKFNKKNIQLMMLEDLFEIHNGYSNNYLDSDTKNQNNEIDDVDNDMDGFDFEKYTGKLLKANGFIKVEVTQCSGDFGVDVIAYKDEIKYAIQCKKYSSPVGIKAVQEVIGSKAMNDCHVAVVLTNNKFTKSAKELAEKNNVLLWDRDKLVDLIENMNK